RAVVEEPLQAAIEVGKLVEQFGLQSLHGKEWDEPDHRADLELDHLAPGTVQLIVIELLLLVPEAHSGLQGSRFGSYRSHSLGDAQEMLEELGGDVLVNRIVQGQFQGNAH